ncbi:hypothetical protein HanIR_Chr15g0756341 [Helianthus annuus]|nr:hypothetical protein HanIR_Chr15g0756341 [Helianthus annuus]
MSTVKTFWLHHCIRSTTSRMFVVYACTNDQQEYMQRIHRNPDLPDILQMLR